MKLSAPKTYLPMFSDLMLGEAMSSHDGVCCYPAIQHSNQEKFILKVVSVPASQRQLAALILTGAFPNREAAMEYYMDMAKDMIRETEVLRELSLQEGFIPYVDAQIVPNDHFTGYEVYMLGNFRLSAEEIFSTRTMTHKEIVSMGLDLCAALAACRRAGHLYMDLKPSNIFYTEDQGYRIGDIGFASLASLAFVSLPKKYHSVYTAPELLDEMSTLNETADVYALGLVLYQAYNGGQLPEFDPQKPLPAPMYADYEFADIILKACHPDPAKRWKDPTQLAQAIVAYIQRNSVSNEDIVPIVAEEEEPLPEEMEEFLPEADEAQLMKEIAELEGTEYEEMGFLSELSQAQTSDSGEDENQEQMPLSDEISQMLAQADDLIAHELPEPAVAPEPVEVPMPDPIVLEPEEDPVDEVTEEPTEAPITEEAASQQEVTIESASETPPVSVPSPKKSAPVVRHRNDHIWKIVAVVLVVITMAAAAFTGYYYHQNYYLLQIDDLILEQSGDVLSVKTVTNVDTSLLTVVCFDSYGNTYRESINAGIAIFKDLDPQTRYTVRLEVSGFHKLIGSISDSITTAAQTTISDLTANIGNEDGSALISFHTSGTYVEDWILTYWADAIEPQQISFHGELVEISGLQIGEEYTFRIAPQEETPIIGNTEVVYTATNILTAQDLAITACANGKLTIQWQAPEGMQDILWTVRCYNSAGYNRAIHTKNLCVTFAGMTHDVPCTVDIVAEGMTKSTSITMTADPITIEDFQFGVTENGMLDILWEHTGSAPESGWILEYTIDNMAMAPLYPQTNFAQLLLIPGAKYTFTVTTTDGRHQYGGSAVYSCPQAEPFHKWGLTIENLQIALCLRPDKENWTAQDVTTEHYISEFHDQQQMGLVILAGILPDLTEEYAHLRFVFHDAEGNWVWVEDVSVLTETLWNYSSMAMDIPWMPETPGQYQVCIYVDGQMLAVFTFSLLETQ